MESDTKREGAKLLDLDEGRTKQAAERYPFDLMYAPEANSRTYERLMILSSNLLEYVPHQYLAILHGFEADQIQRGLRENCGTAEHVTRIQPKQNDFASVIGYGEISTLTYKTERDLLRVLERAEVDDTPLLRFCRAALAVNHSLNLASQKPKSADAARLHSVHEELIERERQENADRQATMNIAWRSQMGL